MTENVLFLCMEVTPPTIYDRVYGRITERLQSSKTYQLMDAINEFVSKYPPQWLTIDSDKKAKAIDKLAGEIYPIQVKCKSHSHDFKGSLVLAGNDNIIPHLVDECARYCVHVEDAIAAFTKANGQPELAAWYKQFTWKVKDIENALVEDLKRIAQQFKFEIDIKYWMSRYKDLKRDYRESIKPNK